MANLDIMEPSTLITDGFLLASSTFRGSENVCIDSANDENILLKDLDSYWDDLNTRLTVSRMVSDSVIRGMVNAIVQEAAEKISSLEAEVKKLNARLRLYESDTLANHKSELIPVQLSPKSQVQSSYSVCSTDNIMHLHNAMIVAENHLQMLKNEIASMQSSNSCGMTNPNSENFGVLNKGNGLDPLTKMDEGIDAFGTLLATMCEYTGKVISSLKDSFYEQQWQCEIEKMVDTIILQNFMGELQVDFKKKLSSKSSPFDIQNKHQLKKADELSSLRQELDSISKSIFGAEPEHSFTHDFHETFEDGDNTKMKDDLPHRGLENNPVTDTSHMEENGIPFVEKSEIITPEVADSSLIFRMPKEDLINYYKAEINKVKRQSESSLHEKTEELFRLKREFLKEKGSLQCKKEKSFEAPKKKFLEIIVKLDKILFETEKFFMVQGDHDQTCSYKQTIDGLLLENLHLHDLLVDKRKEVKCLSSWVSDAASQMSNYSSTEVNLLKKMNNFKWEIEDVKTEAFIRNQIDKCILNELIYEVKSQLDDFHMRNEMLEEYYGIILMQKTLDLEAEKEEKLVQVASLSTVLNDKDRALSLEVKKSEKLKREIVSLLALMEEQSRIASETESMLAQQKEHFERVLEEFNLMKDRANGQEKLISDYREKSEISKARLDEALALVHQYEAKVCDLTQNFMATSNDLQEAEKHKAMLDVIIQEKESEIFSLTASSDEQIVQLRSILIVVEELSKSIAVFQSSIMENIQRRYSRLETLCCQFASLAEQVDILKRRELGCRAKFEIKSFDLKKAEDEVDLLGDEVDALLDILEKIYIALDYYSPVLQHYCGVMEILKLVRERIKRNIFL
uniref:WPP domain-associated protein n=1 Tax=Anthurium amnicola TaxID=1678845 RepID=A0A1D1ZGW9_9ARAE